MQKLDMLFKNLDWVVKRVKQDNDFILVIDGREGSGKSSLALIIDRYLDKNFEVWQIAQTEKEIYFILQKLEKYKVLHVDEGENVFFIRDSMKKENKEMVKSLMSDTRGRNIILLILIPDITMLDKYIKLKRIRQTGAWIHITRRGVFEAFNGKKAADYCRKCMNETSKKHASRPEPDFIGIFEAPDHSGDISLEKLWQDYHKRKMNKINESIQKKLLRAERSEYDFVSMYEAHLLLNLTEDEIMSRIKLQKITAKRDDNGFYVIEMREITRVKEDMALEKKHIGKYEEYVKRKRGITNEKNP